MLSLSLSLFGRHGCRSFTPMSAAACGRCRRRCRGRRPRHGCPGPRPGCRRGGPGGTSQGPGPGCCRPSGRARRRRPRRLGGQGEGERGREGERERGREGGVRRGGVGGNGGGGGGFGERFTVVAGREAGSSWLGSASSSSHCSLSLSLALGFHSPTHPHPLARTEAGQQGEDEDGEGKAHGGWVGGEMGRDGEGGERRASKQRSEGVPATRSLFHPTWAPRPRAHAPAYTTPARPVRRPKRSHPSLAFPCPLAYTRACGANKKEGAGEPFQHAPVGTARFVAPTPLLVLSLAHAAAPAQVRPDALVALRLKRESECVREGWRAV